MNNQGALDYQRIEEAIKYINENFKTQPTLEQIAQKVCVSPDHFQRIFTNWAGTSPKRFLQYTSVNYAKSLLKEKKATLFDTTYATGLSSTSRLHDLFVKIEGMTPAEYKNGGKNLQINYSYHESPFGKIIIASTSIGICYMAFEDDESRAWNRLKDSFTNANFTNKSDDLQLNAMAIFNQDWDNIRDIKLHLRGSEFQLKVWECLIKIPLGGLSTYGKISQEIDNPGASRAVGTAIGSNPIAYLIPCHRVIQSSGVIGGYMWGSVKKSAIIGWEASKVNQEIW